MMFSMILLGVVTVLTVPLITVFVIDQVGYDCLRPHKGDRYEFRSELDGISGTHYFIDGSGSNRLGMIRFMERRMRFSNQHKRDWTFWITDTETGETVWTSENHPKVPRKASFWVALERGLTVVSPCNFSTDG